jgi:excisionase family DNA binding protein
MMSTSSTSTGGSTAPGTLNAPGTRQTPSATPIPTPWMTVSEAAERARTGSKLIYKEVRAGRLQAARVGGRRELRFLVEWIDAWLAAATTIE